MPRPVVGRPGKELEEGEENTEGAGFPHIRRKAIHITMSQFREYS